MGVVRWNPDVRLVFSDVDETIADLYVDISPPLAAELDHLLRDGLR